MANPVSVLDIDVNDQKFRDFLALYQAFQAQLAQLPAGMAAGASAATQAGQAAASATSATAAAATATTTATAASVGQAELMTAALLYQLEVMKEQERLEREKDRAAAAAARTKSEEARKVRDEQRNAEREQDQRERDRQRKQDDHQKKVEQFLKESGALAKGVGLALIGAGAGLFGIDGLAHSVADQRKLAQGLGITAGENAAFQTNFGSRLVGPDFLGSVQDLKTDPTRAWMFDQMGIHDAQEKDAADLGVEVIKRAREMWDRDGGPGGLGHNQKTFANTGLSGVMDYQTYQRIGQASPQDLERYEREYRADVKNMSSPDSAQSAWQDFSVQLHRAGQQIENTFVKGLLPLIPGMTQLSVAFTKMLTSFLSNKHWEEWMDKLGKGLEKLADYLGSDKFDRDIKQFLDDISYAAEKIHSWLDYFGLLPGDDKKEESPLSEGNLLWGDPLHIGDGARWLWHHVVGDASASTPGSLPPGVVPPADTTGGTTPASPAPLPRAVAPSQATPGAPPARLPAGVASPTSAGGNTALGRLIDTIGFLESGNTDHPRDTHDGPRNQAHQGRYQMSEDMQRKYGITNPYDYGQVRPAAEKEESGYLEHFHGNVAEALAAWNEGQGAVDRQIAAAEANRDGTGRSWLERAPVGVQNYVNKGAQRMHVQVSVLNQTGAQVAIAHNAVLQ